MLNAPAPRTTSERAMRSPKNASTTSRRDAGAALASTIARSWTSNSRAHTLYCCMRVWCGLLDTCCSALSVPASTVPHSMQYVPFIPTRGHHARRDRAACGPGTGRSSLEHLPLAWPGFHHQRTRVHGGHVCSRDVVLGTVATLRQHVAVQQRFAVLDLLGQPEGLHR